MWQKGNQVILLHLIPHTTTTTTTYHHYGFFLPTGSFFFATIKHILTPTLLYPLWTRVHGRFVDANDSHTTPNKVEAPIVLYIFLSCILSRIYLTHCIGLGEVLNLYLLQTKINIYIDKAEKLKQRTTDLIVEMA